MPGLEARRFDFGWMNVMNERLVSVSMAGTVAVIETDHPPVNPINAVGPMHWEPAPLLVELVDKGMSLADWEKSKGDAQ